MDVYFLHLLLLRQKYLTPKVKVGKFNFAHSLERFQLVVCWLHGRVAQQRGIAGEEQFLADKRQKAAISK